MFPILLAFLVWLFATGKYGDWIALLGLNTGGATGSWEDESASTSTTKNEGGATGDFGMPNWTDYGTTATSNGGYDPAQYVPFESDYPQ